MDVRDQENSSKEGIRITECIEWSLVIRLHKQMSLHLLPVTVNIKFDEERPRNINRMTVVAYNRWQSLNLEMRKALTRPDLEVLIHLDAESGNDSTEVLEEARSLLQGLCRCLEELVNNPFHRRLQQSPSNPYPNLVDLLNHLEQLRSKGPNYEFLSTTPSDTVLFVHTSIPALEHIDSPEDHFNQFNQFIDDLQASAASSDDLLDPVSAEINFFPDLNYPKVFNKRFHRHTVTALQAIFSTFSKCNQQEQTKRGDQGVGGLFFRHPVTAFQKVFATFPKSDQQERTEHKVMLGLPCWEELCVGGGGSAPLILNMLCTFCTSSSSTNWQEIQIISPG